MIRFAEGVSVQDGTAITLTMADILEGFFVRRDAFGFQAADGEMETRRGQIKTVQLQAHLRGEIRIGAHCLGTDSSVMWACVDIDADRLPAGITSEEAVRRVIARLEATGFSCLVEKSKSRGYHVWIFFGGPVPAWKVRGCLAGLLAEEGLPDLEVFPKQNYVEDTKDKLGNFVWLPWHGKSVKEGRTVFLGLSMEGWTPFADQAEALTCVSRVEPATLDAILAARGIAEPPPKRKDEPPTFEAAPCEVSLDSLRVPRPIKQLIVTGWTPGGAYPSRSELDEAVLVALVRERHSDDEIHGVFSNPAWGIGAKYRERGEGDHYLALSLNRARELLHANGDGPPSVEIVEDELAIAQSSQIGMPAFPESAWCGLFARWRDLVCPCSEAPAVLHFLTFKVVTGLILRRRVCFRYPHPHYPNFFSGFVGTTGDAHKTTALWFGEELARDLGMKLNVVSGVSSPEGLLERIGAWEMDETGQRVPVPAPPALLYCDELGSLLAKARMDATAGILPKLTRLYDCPTKDENPTRGRPLIVLEPTVGLLTGTTREVLDKGLRDSDLTDGFLNRVIWVTSADHPNPIPDPRPPGQTAWNKLLSDLRASLGYWPVGTAEIPLDSQAFEAWREIYAEWKRKRDAAPPSLVLKATARTHTHIRKLALLRAALECKPMVDEATIVWAAELGDYFEDVARWLLQDAILAPTRNVALEQRIIRYLRDRASRANQRSTRAIVQALHHYATVPEIKAALRGMVGLRLKYEPVKTMSGQRSDLWTVIE